MKENKYFSVHRIALIGILPVMVVYPLVQKYFIKGIVIGAVKE